MTIQSISTGTSANKGDGESLRSAFHKINQNFTYLSTIAAAISAPPPVLGDISFTGPVISNTVTNQSIIFDPNGTGLVKFRNTAIQFDNGSEAKGGDSIGHIIYTKGAGSKVGLGVDTTSSSLRIVGDADVLGTLADFGIYNGVGNSWSSKFHINSNGGFTALGAVDLQDDVNIEGVLRAAGGVFFADGSTQTSATPKLTLSYVTSSTTVSGVITEVNTIRFDTESGFSLIDLGQGAVELAMNSTFKYWEVDGQETLVAEGLDHIEFVSGPGILITTNTGTNPMSITFEATGGNASIGDMLVDSTVFFANTSSKTVKLANIESSTGSSYILLPAASDSVNPAIFSSPNEVRITTEIDSTAPITVSPNVDGNGPGYVVIGDAGTTSTAGLFAFSAAAEIDFWPNSTIAQLVGGADAGTLDLRTLDDNNISIRPNGIGSVIVTGNIEARKGLILSTNTAGAGAIATDMNYQSIATALDINKQVHLLSSSDYYLPPGIEGQLVHFVPATGAAQDIKIWVQSFRTYVTGSAAVTSDAAWYPFSASASSNGAVYAIYTDSAWTMSHSFTS